jgi:hypothetical protein
MLGGVSARPRAAAPSGGESAREFDPDQKPFRSTSVEPRPRKSVISTASRKPGLEFKMFFVAYYEHWSSGSAAAVFDDEAAAKAAFYENNNIEKVDAPSIPR